MELDTAVRGVVTCVDYDDLLSVTLPRNMRHLTECVVVTVPRDERTKAVARAIPNVQVVETEAFYAGGAKFNKGAGLNAGFEALGRRGWVLVWDADCLFAEGLRFENLEHRKLYSCQRRVLKDASLWNPLYKHWESLPTWRHKCLFVGYFQLFHASDPRLVGRKKWYEENHSHAGGADHNFSKLWPMQDRIELPWEVLHLGPHDTNWYGRVSPRIDGETMVVDEEARAGMNSMIERRGWEEWERA